MWVITNLRMDSDCRPCVHSRGISVQTYLYNSAQKGAVLCVCLSESIWSLHCGGYCVVSSERLHVLGGCLQPHILPSTGLEGSLSKVLQRIMGSVSLAAACCNLQR